MRAAGVPAGLIVDWPDSDGRAPLVGVLGEEALVLCDEVAIDAGVDATCLLSGVELGVTGADVDAGAIELGAGATGGVAGAPECCCVVVGSGTGAKCSVVPVCGVGVAASGWVFSGTLAAPVCSDSPDCWPFWCPCCVDSPSVDAFGCGLSWASEVSWSVPSRCPIAS